MNNVHLGMWGGLGSVVGVGVGALINRYSPPSQVPHKILGSVMGISAFIIAADQEINAPSRAAPFSENMILMITTLFTTIIGYQTIEALTDSLSWKEKVRPLITLQIALFGMAQSSVWIHQTMSKSLSDM